MNKKTLFLILFGALLFPLISTGQTIEGIVENVVYRVAWPVAVGSVIIFWIATGILFLSGMGSPDKLSLARKALIAAVAGTIVIIIAASAMTIIGNALI